MRELNQNTGIFQKFLNSEKAGGLILMCCTVVSLLIANSGLGTAYIQFWHTPASVHFGALRIPFRIEEWINDGLMTIFFLMVGLEIERELYVGELASPKHAILPALAAVGGMAVPALIHYVFNQGRPEAAGIGIPTATDIAFSLGVLSLIGNRIPLSLKIFLTALAIMDDLGAILIIGIFYTRMFSLPYLLLSLGVFGVLLIANRINRMSLWIYLPLGLLLWYFLYRSGIHPTLSGVLLAFAIPFRKYTDKHPSARLQNSLHRPVNFLILPLFALANTAIQLPDTWMQDVFSRNSLGIILGLLLGKPLGIISFVFLAVRLGIARLPAGVDRLQILGVGMLAGIGFTMSVFISNLAFSSGPFLIQESKVAVLLASLLAAVCGWFILKKSIQGSVVLPPAN